MKVSSYPLASSARVRLARCTKLTAFTPKLEELQNVGASFNNIALKGEMSGPRGYLAFEAQNAGSRDIDGFELGALLRDAGVPTAW